MDLCNKVLSKAPISWMDVQKQLLTVMQTRTTSMASNYSSSTGSFGLAINKSSVKQCTDLLIKHIKNLNQAQVIDQLNNFAQSCSLSVYETPSEEEPTTVNAFLSNADFFFSVWISLSGEITDVKFSLFSEEAKKNNLLKEMFRTWNWELLYKHIDGIKSNFILSQPADSQVKMNAYKAIQCLEKELNSLYQIETKYLDRLNTTNRLNKPITPSLQSKYLDILVNQTPVGIFKKSELGEAMRLYYYLSPLDLIKHNSTTTGEKFDRTLNTLTQLTVDQLLKHDLGAYLTISLQSTFKNSTTNNETNNFKLPDCSLLLLNENDESSWYMFLDSYLNNNLSFEKKPLFSSLNSNSSFPLANFKQNGQLTGVEVPGAFLVKFNKPIVMCKNTLIQLQTRLGIETVNVETIAKLTPFFELLAKTEINSKILNDAYSVQLPDESQVYYITELDQPNCMGVLVEKLMFTQPQDLLAIIETIRKQLLFNELLLSCMKTMCSSAISITNNNNNNYKLTNYNHTNGTNNNNSTNNVRILEIGLLAPFVVSIIMQHPFLLCYTTIEIDVSQGNIETKFRDHNDLHNPNVISEIIRRCHSIPVTIRALLMKYKQASSSLNKQRTGNNDNGNGNNGNGSNNNNEQNHKDGHGDDSENYNFNNNTNTNTTHLNNKFNTNGNQHDRNFDSDSVVNDQINDANIDLQITPRSLTHPEGNFNFSPGANPTNSTAVLNRLTPSRRDSFNRTSSTSSSSSSSSGATSANLIKTPSSIFEFSNVINEQKQQQKQLMLIKSKSVDSPDLDRKNKETNDENKPNSNLINTPLLLDNKQFQTPSPSQNNKSAAKPGSSSLLKPNSGCTGSNNKTPLNSSNKKRKAPNNEIQQSTSTPNSTTNTVNSTTGNQSSMSSNTITQPPSAKRKMTQNLQDFKRHTSLIEDPTQIGNDILNSSGSLVTKVKSNNPNSSSVTLAKKPKLKNSISSVDLSSAVSSSSTSSSKSSLGGKSSENSNTRKETFSTVVSSGVNNSSVKTNVKKEKELSSSGVLTAALINSNPAVVKTANSKLTNSTNKSLPTHLKKSQSNKQLNDSSPSSNTTSTSANKQSTSLTSGSSSSGQLPMKIKPVTEDGLKIRISKDSLTNKQRSNSSSSINNNSLLNKTGSNSNLSAAEIQLKQPVFSSPAAINSSINSINNTPASGIQDKSNRTPSPSPLSSSLTTPSPIHHSDDSPENETGNSSSLPKYEPPVKQAAKQQNKRQTSDSIYNLKPSSAPLSSTAAIVSTANIKPNTPPLPTSSNSLASFALGLGTGFKTSSFKIPHKSKTQTNSEDNSKIETDEKSSPLSTSSPASSSGSINRSVGSPSKSTTPPQSDLKTPATSTKTSRPSVSMPPPSNIDQTRSTGNQRTNNSSPKWQPSYHSGNISPRYNNNFDQTTASSTPVPLLSSASSSNLSKNQPKNSNNNNNNNNSSNNNKHTINNNNQRSQSAGSRPLTPIPSFVSNQHHQLNNNGSNRLINNFSKTPLGPPLPPLAHPVPLMNQSKTIPSLMSFSNHLPTSSFSAKDSSMTPTSPVNDTNPIPIQETKIIKESREVMSPTPSSSASSIPQPPDSPICESAPIVIPKLIPLERNLSTPSITPTSNNNDYYNQNNKAKTSFTSSFASSSKLKTNITDIASPDTVMHSEEDDDNLVIDLIPTNYSNKHLISSGSSGSMRNNSRNAKSPCILEEDLVSNEALIS